MVVITQEYLNSILERELNCFEEYCLKYKLSVATNDEWGIKRWSYEMDKYADKAKLLREIIDELKRKEIKGNGNND